MFKEYYVTIVKDSIGVRVIVDKEELDEDGIPYCCVTHTLIELLGFHNNLAGSGEELGWMIKNQGGKGLRFVEDVINEHGGVEHIEALCYYVNNYDVKSIVDMEIISQVHSLIKE